MDDTIHPDQHKIDDRTNAINQGYADADGFKVVAGRIGGPRGNVNRFVHDPDNPTHLDLRRFAEWRKSKCLPRNYDQPGDRLADLDQSTLELTGEAGEVAEVILRVSDEPTAIYDPKLREKLADEIGDVIFCASWHADAWGPNPLRTHAKMGEALRNLQVTKEERSLATLVRLGLLLNCQTGLLANAAKKVLVQGRDQDINVQFTRLTSVFDYCAMILSIAGSDVYEATARVVAKLDHRFPEGHPLVGGGIRTGIGA